MTALRYGGRLFNWNQRGIWTDKTLEQLKVTEQRRTTLNLRPQPATIDTSFVFINNFFGDCIISIYLWL